MADWAGTGSLPLSENLRWSGLTEEIAEAEAQVAELDGTIKGEGATEDEDEEEARGDEGGLTEHGTKTLKNQRTTAKKKLTESIAKRLKEAHEALSVGEARERVQDILKGDLRQGKSQPIGRRSTDETQP